MKSIVSFLLLLLGLVASLHCQAQPTILANGPLELVPNGSVTLSASGFNQYRWTRNNVDAVGTQSSVVVNTPGYYRVEGNNGGSWQISTAVRVTVRPGAGSPDKSYSQEDAVLQEGIFADADVDLAQTRKSRTFTYLDGLMRPTQQVAVKATAETPSAPNGLDVVQFYEYDAAGQQPRSYLPYAGGSNGSFKPNALAEQQSFYSTSGPVKVARVTGNLTYAETVFEDTPGGGAIEQGGPGTSWQIAKDANGKSTFQGHTKRTVMRASTANEVALFTYTPGTGGVVGSASYTLSSVGALTATQVTDEDGKAYTEYTNQLGQTVGKRTALDNGQYMHMAHAYDELGRTVMTLTPEGVKRAVTDGESIDAAFLNRWAYLYTFDVRGRAIGKKVPGREWMYTVYDRWDRVVASQDGNQRAQEKWAFVKYDELNRTIITGQIYSRRTQPQLTADIESAVAAGSLARYEDRADNATGAVRIGYTLNKSWPATATGNDLLAVSYFDDYRFLNSGQARLQYQQEATSDLASPSAASLLTVDLPTIGQVRILGSNNWLVSVTYYDDKARAIQTKSENQLGGVERFTTEYDYAGKVLRTYTAHNVNNNTPAHTIRYRYTYYSNDSPKELYAWFNKSTGTDEILLSKKEYNELGQLVDDKLGTTYPASGTYLQSVDYRYNIRGWLTHINNRGLTNGQWLGDTYPNQDADAEDDLFGFELKYDTDLQTGTATPRYNGNIAESLWNSRRNPKLRGYAYHYDNANRLTEAKYSAYDYVGGAWGWNGEKDDAAAIGRFTTSGIGYDRNGNITQLDRVGHKTTVAGQPQFGPIDQLRYQYDGNRLLSVTDGAGPSAASNDFENQNKWNHDYYYDANGSMVEDSNKDLQVEYNELDLPSTIYHNSYASQSEFTYSATGEKLGQDTYSGKSIKKINYVGGFEYGQGPLLTVATPVGRALYGSTPDNSTQRWMQEYHIRDHLGNLRLAFRDEGRTVQRLAATMEQANAEAEEQNFDNLTATRQLDPEHARTGSYAARLNAGQSQRMFGPSASVQVSAGDSVHFEVYGRYDVRHQARLWPAVLPVAAAANAPAAPETTDGRATPRRGLLPRLAAGITLAWTALPRLFERRQETPRASVKYDLYDQDSTLVASEVRYLDPSAANEWQRLEVGFKAKEAGYVLISLQNATAEDVWFDDAELRTTQDMIVQENHYDPWGQNLVNIEYEGSPNEQWQFGNQERISEGNLEWVDHGARYYDPQLGRWHVQDPEDQFASPYVGLGNNPIIGRDPDGRFWHIVIGAAIGGVVNVATHWGQIKNFKDGLVAFGIGAAAGAITAATGGAVLAGTTLTAASIGGGALLGATGAVVGSPVQGIGNSAYFGDDYSAKQWGTDILIGGITGGIAGGVANKLQRVFNPDLPETSILTGRASGNISVDPLQVTSFGDRKVSADYNGLEVTIKGDPNKVYSARELIRRSAEPGAYHNFPESFNKSIFQGEKIIKPNYYNVGKPGLSNTGILYRAPGILNGTRGFYEIATRPSISGRTELIIHRFFKPTR